MISESEFQSIRQMIEDVVPQIAGTRRDYFVTGQVIKVDKKNKLVWLREFQAQAIPVISFDYDVTYYDTDNNGIVRRKVTKATVRMPRVGQTVVVAMEMGLSRLPRCLGIVQGRGWISEE